MLNADTWAAIAAIAAAVTAGLTFAIALANAFQTWAQARAADFENCLDVVTKLAEAQRLVRDAGSDTVRDFELRELLNLMEALAQLANDRRIARSTRKVTEHFLIESWAYLVSQEHSRLFIKSSVTSESTFLALHEFAERHEDKTGAACKYFKLTQNSEFNSQAPEELGVE